MAVSLSPQLQLGFKVGVTNFFLVTLMKMNFKLDPFVPFLDMQSRGPTKRACGLLFHQDADSVDLVDLEANTQVFAGDAVVKEKM